MTTRRYEVEVTCTVIVEIDDEAVSEYYEGEKILTSHLNRDRFVEGSTPATAVGALAITLGINGARMGRTDGWADFPENSAWATVTDYHVEEVAEVNRG